MSDGQSLSIYIFFAQALVYIMETNHVFAYRSCQFSKFCQIYSVYPFGCEIGFYLKFARYERKLLQIKINLSL